MWTIDDDGRIAKENVVEHVGVNIQIPFLLSARMKELLELRIWELMGMVKSKAIRIRIEPDTDQFELDLIVEAKDANHPLVAKLRTAIHSLLTILQALPPREQAQFLGFKAVTVFVPISYCMTAELLKQIRQKVKYCLRNFSIDSIDVMPYAGDTVTISVPDTVQPHQYIVDDLVKQITQLLAKGDTVC